MGGRGNFACPECGRPIAPTGLTPGREVICPACSTLVEVPYLPRAIRPRARWDLRPKPARGRWSGRRGLAPASKRRLRWALAVGSVVAVVLATRWTVGAIEAKARSDREEVIRHLIAASDQAESIRDTGEAFREIEAALTLARQIDTEGSRRLDSLIERRDRADRAEVEARLAALDRLAVDQAAGEALILDDRARHDPALATLRDAIAAKVEATADRQAETDRDLARAALKAGRGIEAFKFAARAHDRGGRLADRAVADRIREDARATVVEAVERFGATVAPAVEANGGGIDRFATPIWTEALTSRGYLLPPPGTPWAEVWTAHAVYQASSKVTESTEGLYLQSNNRATRIDGQFALTLRGRMRWQTRVFAQTRSPLPDLPAYIAGRLATTDRRDPEIERRLRDDARTAFRIQLDRNFRGIPALAPDPAPVAPTQSGPDPARSS